MSDAPPETTPQAPAATPAEEAAKESSALTDAERRRLADEASRQEDA